MFASIHIILRKPISEELIILAVIVVLVLGTFLLFEWTVRAPGLVDPVVDASVANTLAATVVEPSIAAGTHALAGLLALGPRGAVRHVSHRAVHRHHVWLQLGLILFIVVGF